MNLKKCEILAPAGSFKALEGAISAGADAIYLGLSGFNARKNAKNFSRDELSEAVKLCRLYDRKLYVTLNTLVFDREIREALDEAWFCASVGVDALIVQDLGLMDALHKTIPEIALHASTQCATHNLEQLKLLSSLGATRAVVDRELTKTDLEILCKNSPIEIEAFVHGALCMSHSGTCLMSAYMGGRSGNRGECAQPCRLPYVLGKGESQYPLSLKDLSLATHLTELREMGVSSLKIEGRMKSPEYVYKTVSVFRRLLDKDMNANECDMEELSQIFSRSGFTDGYYTGKKGRAMFGIRAEADKSATRQTESETEFSLPKIPVDILFEKRGDEAVLTMSTKDKSVSCSTLAEKAEGSGTTREDIESALVKMGQTPFYKNSIEIKLDTPAFFKRSSLNALRRECAEKLCSLLTGEPSFVEKRELFTISETKSFENELWTIFSQGARTHLSIAQECLKKTERVFLPFSVDFPCPDKDRVGVNLPRAVFESETAAFEKELKRLSALGYTFALSDNTGVAKIAQRLGFDVWFGAGANVTNSYTQRALEEMGFEGGLVSWEMNEPQKKGLKYSRPTGDIVYGKAPLMLVENCVIGTRDGCISCKTEHCTKREVLIDRTGESFSVLPDAFHRATIFNSRPTYRADTEGALPVRAIYISDEKDALKIIDTVLAGKAPSFKFTRK